MGRGQSLGNLPANLQHLGHFERAVAVEFLLERLAGDELHHQVGKRLLGDLVDLHHVLMPDGRRRTGFAQEPLAGRRGGGHLRGHHLDGDHALQDVVKGPKHNAKATRAKHLEDFVMPEAAEGIRPGGG